MAEGGLLDFFKSPEGQGLLAAGFGALAGRGTRAQAIGQGGLAGLLAYGRAGEMQADRERQNVIDQRQSQMFDWQKSAYEQQQAAQQRQQQQQADRNAYLGTIGQYKDDFSTQQNKFDPMEYIRRGGSVQEAEKIGELYNPKPMSVKEGESLINPSTFQPVFTAPKQAAPTELARLTQEMNALPPGSPLRAIYQAAITKATTHSPGTSVNVNTDALGLKPKDRFEMEGKLSGDYEKATATDSAVLNATGKIRSAFTQEGALKDQAAIYAFAKMLDPDGAVREADYAAISGAAGLVDRVRNYTQKLLNGEQLTPTQRQEMIKLSDAFDQVANRRITDQRKRYSQQAERYNLRPEAVLTPQAPQQPKAAPKPSVSNW